MSTTVRNSQPATAWHPRQTLTLGAMCLALGMAALDDTVVNVALPSLQSQLALSVSGLQWMLNAYLLPIACLVLPAGTLGDRYGRKQVFLAGLMGFIGASVLVGLSTTGTWAIAGRLLQGIGAAAMLPTSLAIVSETFPQAKERAKAIGLWSGVSGLALIVGPALGGALVDAFGWRSIFFLNLPLGALTAWLTCRALPRRPGRLHERPGKRPDSQGRGQLDWPGMIFSAIALAALIMGLMAEEAPWLQRFGLGALSVGSAVAFWVIERFSARPMLPLSLFRQPTFAAALIANGLLFYMLVSLMFLFSLFLQQVQGYSAIATGMRFLPLNGMFILASGVSGYFCGWLGWRRTLTLGFAIAGAAMLSLSQVGADTAYGGMVVQLMVVGFGVGFTLSPLTAAGMGSAPVSKSGIAAALFNTSTRLGGALGIALQGSLFTQGMANHLSHFLEQAAFPEAMQPAIIAEALGHGTTRPAQLQRYLFEAASAPRSPEIAFSALEQAVHQAFVAGMHQAVWAGAIALFIGAGLSALYIRSERQPTAPP